MKISPLRWISLLALFAFLPARAEMRLLATASSDSYESFTYGLGAFFQEAGFPFALTGINDFATDNFLVPNLAGIDVQASIGFLWLMKVNGNAISATPATVAVLPTTDHGSLAFEALARSYPQRTLESFSENDAQFLCFSRATETNREAAVVYAAIKQNMILTSRSREAMLWAVTHPLPITNTRGNAVAGQVHIEGDPAALAVFFKSRKAQQSASHDFLQEGLDTLFSEATKCSLTLEATAEGVTLDAGIRPLPGTPLAENVQRMRVPDQVLGRVSPKDASVALTSGGVQISTFIHDSLAQQKQDSQALQTGDMAVFVDHMGKDEIYIAAFRGIRDTSAASAEVFSAPLKLLPFSTGLDVTTNGTRRIGNTWVHDYAMDTTHSGPSPEKGSDNPLDFIGFLMQGKTMSVACVSNNWVVTLGPSNAMNQALECISRAWANPANSLASRCEEILPRVPETEICSAFMIKPVVLIKEIVMSFPGMNAESLSKLPSSGKGFAGFILRGKHDQSIHFLLRVPAKEVNAMQSALNESRASMQESLSRMALQHMLQNQILPKMPERFQQHPGLDHP